MSPLNTPIRSFAIKTLLLLLALGGSQNPAMGVPTQHPWKEYYFKATVATFYSASVLNGYYDIRLAGAYLDSCEAALKSSPPNGREYAEAFTKINRLRNELNVSTGIAVDNMNYRYPAFSVMSGHRPEFNVVDDTEELLIESVIDRVISAPDPLVKGNLKDNTHFVLLNVNPYNETIFTVGLDYLGTNTGFYAIRLHELSTILDPAGFARFKSGALDSSDFRTIMESYGIDKLVCLNVRDNGSLAGGLFYKGITLQTVTLPEAKPRYVTYFEGFKVDKKESSSTATGLFLINAVLVTLLLLFLAVIRIDRNPFRMNLFFSKELGLSLGILISGALASVFVAYYLSTLIPTEINQYHSETMAKLWVLHHVLAPTIICAGISYLLQYKFSKEVVNSSAGFTRILFVSFTFPTLLVSYFEYYAELIPGDTLKYLVPLQAILFLPVSIHGGRVINALVKKEPIVAFPIIMLVIACALWFAGIWFDLRDLNDFSLLCTITSALFAGIGLLSGRIRLNNSVKHTSKFTVAGHSLLNPTSYITGGLNIPEVQKEITRFLNEDTQNMLVLQGEHGIGKSRFIREMVLNTDAKWVFYLGDCNEFPEGNAQLYEPFFNAFCQHEGQAGNLPKGFFVDRSGLSRNISKVVKLAGSAAPVDIGSVLSVEEDGSNRSVQEISSELLDILIQRRNESDLSRQILIIDDCQWMDQGTQELLSAFINQIRLRTKYSRYFKVILVTENNYSRESAFGKWLQGDNSLAITTIDLAMKDEMEFVNEVISMDTFHIGRDTNKGVGFASILKNHLLQICGEEAGERAKQRNKDSAIAFGFTPGDFFGYLAALEKKGYLKIDGDMLRLTAEPPGSDIINLKSGRSDAMTSEFESLDTADQLLLESAAHIGYKFDADILASIWKRDILDVIRQLEKLQYAGFVIDLHEEDNLFAFQDKELHRIIRTRSQQSEDTDERVRQLVIEYQKRIIETIVNKGEDYIRSLDLDILQSAIQRCFKYEKVDLIRKHTPLIGMYTSLKYAQAGKISKSADTLLRIFPLIDNFTEEQVSILARIFSLAVEMNTLREFDRAAIDVMHAEDIDLAGSSQAKLNMIDEILRKSRLRTSKSTVDFESIVHIVLRDIFRRIRGASAADKLRFEQRKSRIIQYQQGFTDQQNKLRVDFYLELLEAGNAVTLQHMLDDCLQSSFDELAGEIARHLSLISHEKPQDQLRYACVSLLLLSGNKGQIDSLQELKVLDAEQIKKTIYGLLGKESLRSRKAADLNYTISRFRDYFYNTADKADCTLYEDCIYFCDMAYDLSQRLHDERGCEMAMSYKGASLYQLKRFEESMDVYKKYFEWLITRTKEKSRFSYAIEGIGLNCQALNNYEVYEWLKRELYEHLLFVSKNMQEMPLQFSLIDKKKSLKDILPYAQADASELQDSGESDHELRSEITLRIIELLVCLAHSDGAVDDNERHDLTESAIALAYSLNLPHKTVRSAADQAYRKIASLEPEKRLNHFKEACLFLSKQESPYFTKAILRLCNDMVHADGKVTDEERRYLKAAEALLNEI
jgi:hypothetical protein